MNLITSSACLRFGHLQANAAGDSKNSKNINNKRCCNFSCNKNFKQIIMLDESVTDFRNLIEEKLKAKQDALGQTEAHLKKFSIIRELKYDAYYYFSLLALRRVSDSILFRRTGAV